MTDRVPALRVGISACLLGQAVRFDGGHKRDAFLTEILGPHVEWVPVCPEVEMGLGTPRETLRLVRQPKGLRLITTRTAIDHTEAMHAWSARRLSSLSKADLDGYVLKKDSPSCGMERVKTFSPSGMPARDGRGLFAAALVDRLPLLPVEEEGRLSDPHLRESFIERLFAYRRLKALFAGRWSPGALVRFHTAHKMSLLAHSTTAYRELGRLVADGAGTPRAALREAYESLFMKTMALPATAKRHANVLSHMAGHLKTLVDAGSRQEMAACIEDYRRGFVPLVVPLTLMRHHVHFLLRVGPHPHALSLGGFAPRQARGDLSLSKVAPRSGRGRLHGVAYLAGQTYLDPHPRELMLRNHV